MGRIPKSFSSLIHTSQFGGRLTAADPLASVVKEVISPDNSSPSKLSNTLKDAPSRRVRSLFRAVGYRDVGRGFPDGYVDEVFKGGVYPVTVGVFGRDARDGIAWNRSRDNPRRHGRWNARLCLPRANRPRKHDMAVSSGRIPVVWFCDDDVPFAKLPLERSSSFDWYSFFMEAWSSKHFHRERFALFPLL